MPLGQQPALCESEKGEEDECLEAIDKRKRKKKPMPLDFMCSLSSLFLCCGFHPPHEVYDTIRTHDPGPALNTNARKTKQEKRRMNKTTTTR